MPRNWDQHYAQNHDWDRPPSPLLAEATEWVPPGRALDLACGAGRNALYLARLGWQVVAVDASAAAIRILREQASAAGLTLDARVADLEQGSFAIDPAAYDLICDFFYLDRALFPLVREGVRPGGLFAAEIHLRDETPHRFVLEPGELRREFESWKILYYSETLRPGHTRPSAAILARRA